MQSLKNISLLLATTILLGGVGWYLYHSIQVVEAPSMNQDDPQNVSDLPHLPGSTTTSTSKPGEAEQPTASGVHSFEECVAAGNLVMESYPRKCSHAGVLYVEEVPPEEEPVACTADAKLCPDGTAVGRSGPNCEFAPCPSEDEPNDDVTICTPESKQAEFCTEQYAPVCGLVQVQCITTPCDPVPQTFSNGCSACAQNNVVSYTAGACESQ